jgi:choline-sulfatase
MDWAKRLVYALTGATVTTLVVSLVEAQASSVALGSHGPTFGALVLADVGMLGPLGLGLGLAVGATMIFLEPDRARAPQEYLVRLREEPVLTRSRTAALVPLLCLAAFAWCVATAHLGRSALADGAPLAAGLGLSAR